MMYLKDGTPCESLYERWPRWVRVIFWIAFAVYCGAAILLPFVAHAQEFGESDKLKWLTMPTSGTAITAKVTTANGCSIATIAMEDGAVTVDWGCIEKYADRRGDMIGSVAYVLKAIRDGKAKEVNR